MDRDTRKSVMKEVRKSIVRISFNWEEDVKGKTKKTIKKFMVIAGVIVSVKDGSAVIAAGATFFKDKSKFVVNFPNAEGYEEPALDVLIPNGSVKDGDHFYTFTLTPRNTDYIKPIRFETVPVKDGDKVDAFVFPEKDYITPAGYCRGSIVRASDRVIFHDCKMHEYGYLGSPVLNLRGDFVGITYLDMGHLYAWTVQHIQNVLLVNMNSTLVFNGSPQRGEVAEAPMEEQNI